MPRPAWVAIMVHRTGHMWESVSLVSILLPQRSHLRTSVQEGHSSSLSAPYFQFIEATTEPTPPRHQGPALKCTVWSTLCVETPVDR